MNYKKVAIIGGSFDPIHNGHIAMGEKILDTLNVDVVLYVPTIQNPLKDKTMTSYKHRANMVKLALKEKMELYEDDHLYTYDFIQDLKSKYQFEKIYFVVGDDQISQLNQWSRIDKLLNEVTFVAFSRDGKISESEYPIQRILLEDHFESSTQVRNGDFTMIDKKVKNYIYDNVIYLVDIVKSHVDEHRFNHTISVAKTAKKIAEVHHLNEIAHKCYLAGLLHDICKCMDKAVLKAYMEKYFPKKMHLSDKVWHSYVGSIYVQEKLQVEDQLIISAIKNHTILEDITTFNLIIKLADTIEPLRKKINKEVEKMAYIDLKKAYEMLINIYKEK